jgi:hypothetical protein
MPWIAIPLFLKFFQFKIYFESLSVLDNNTIIYLLAVLNEIFFFWGAHSLLTRV